MNDKNFLETEKEIKTNTSPRQLIKKQATLGAFGKSSIYSTNYFGNVNTNGFNLVLLLFAIIIMSTFHNKQSSKLALNLFQSKIKEVPVLE